MRVSVRDAHVEFITRPFARPLQLSTGTIHTITEARASVSVAIDGRQATGQGSIYLSDLWAWPESALSHEERDRILRGYSLKVAGCLPKWCGEPAHPLELGLRLHHRVEVEGVTATFEPAPDTDDALPGHSMQLPILAREMCASPFDAALHDAAGRALQCSAFDFYKEACTVPSADYLFPGEGACAAVNALFRRPAGKLDAWLVVGKGESLESVLGFVRENGYRRFKLKLSGADTAADVRRTLEIFHTVRAVSPLPWLSVDTNEANPDVASVLDYLVQLREADAEAFETLKYLEQPTGRDIRQHAFNWRPVTALKPVLLDEGLTSLELLGEARQQGWSGLALKTCKGHSFILVAATWARRRGMRLCLQDLTNPGYAAIHAALFAAHVATTNGIELNSFQFTPAANDEWMPRLRGLFEPKDGLHSVPTEDIIGLGTNL